MNILIIRLSSFGDVLLTSFIVRCLKQTYPSANLYFLTKREMLPLIEYNRYLTGFFTYEYDNDLRNAQLNQLKTYHFDWVIDLQANFRSHPFRSLSKQVAVFNKNRLKRFFYVHFKTPFNQEPVALRYFTAAKNLTLHDDGDGLDFFLPVTVEAKMQQLFSDWESSDSTTTYFIAAGAKHFTKRYPAEYFVRLIQLIKSEKPNSRFILLGGKDEMDTSNEIKKRFSDLSFVWNATGAFSLLESAALLKLCQAGFSNDSFLMHVATAFQIPVVSFFGSTTPQLGFAPFRSPSLLIEDLSVTCRPCTHIGRNKCPKKHFNCMLNLKPEIILPKIVTFLNENKIG